MPRDHAFVRSTDPAFGSAFGGGCAHKADAITCGWPEVAHQPQSNDSIPKAPPPPPIEAPGMSALTDEAANAAPAELRGEEAA